MKHFALSACGLLLALPLAAAADSYRCESGELVRRIEIVYEPGRAVPCEVHYHKDSESPGAPQVLWTAQNEAGYCEARAAELAETLRGHGWSCTAATTDDAGEPEEDDTDALAPAADVG